jgi:hypothetical protein
MVLHEVEDGYDTPEIHLYGFEMITGCISGITRFILGVYALISRDDIYILSLVMIIYNKVLYCNIKVIY